MTTDIGRLLAEHFGAAGLRRFEPAELADVDLSPESRARLVELGLPVQIGPYFIATSGEPLPLGAYAESIGFTDVPADQARWCRLGTDRGAEICLAPTGEVRAVFVVADAPAMQVNAGLDQFAAGLLALDRHLPQLASPGHRDPAELFRELRQEMLAADAPALQDDEAWWPQVLETIRHALSFPFSAAFEVQDSRGEKRIETEQAQVGLPHPEQMLWIRLESEGVQPEQVVRVYTELEPCFMPGNYCAMWLSQFPNAEFTHSFDYGGTAQNREAGFLELMQYAAAQR